MNTFYKVTNLLDSKYYYGVHKTEDLNDNYYGSGIRIYNAVKKYGKNKFKKEIVLQFNTYQEALDYEAFIVDASLLLDPSCYNLKEGGKGGSFKGRKISEETRQKMSKSSKDRAYQPHTEETKEKIRKKIKDKTNFNKGKHINHTEEWKEKQKNKKFKHTEESKHNMREAWIKRRNSMDTIGK